MTNVNAARTYIYIYQRKIIIIIKQMRKLISTYICMCVYIYFIRVSIGYLKTTSCDNN